MVVAQPAHTSRMIRLGRQQIAQAPASEHNSDSNPAIADVLAWNSSIDLMTVPAAWPVAVSDLAQKFMACQIRETRDRRG